MSKIAILLPKEQMLGQAENIMKENMSDITEVKVIKTSESIIEAKAAIEKGASIIVARGVQASNIISHTNIPVAEIIITGQELGLLVTKAKRILKKEKPKIAIVGLSNMFSDTKYFNEIFEIDLKMYLVESVEKIVNKVEEAIKDNVDIIIGGDTAMETVKHYDMDIPFLFLESTGDSIENALETARKMQYTAEIVSKSMAGFETILDTSVQGIMRIDNEKNITVINKQCEEMLQITNNKVKGKALTNIISEIKDEYLELILKGKRDIYSTSIRINEKPVMLSLCPIKDEHEVYGVLATFYRIQMNEKDETHMEEIKNRRLKWYVARSEFSSLDTSNLAMYKCVELGKIYALSKHPVLIYGEVGTEKEFFAQCIHNNSSFKNGPFVSVNCGGLIEEKQIELLFGSQNRNDIKKGALELGNNGTILISEIDKLSPICQYRLYKAIHYDILVQNDLEKNLILDNRIIVTSSEKLDFLVKDGIFREDLFYLLNSLVLDIPPIRDRKDEIKNIINGKLKEFSKDYSKFLKLTDNALKTIEEYNWNGNRVQLESFCERLFLTTQKRLISENFVEYLLDELYPDLEEEENIKKVVIYKHPKAKEINELLEKYNGNRGKVAKELNISTTTLWRHIKKYGVIYNK